MASVKPTTDGGRPLINEYTYKDTFLNIHIRRKNKEWVNSPKLKSSIHLV